MHTDGNLGRECGQSGIDSHLFTPTVRQRRWERVYWGCSVMEHCNKDVDGGCTCLASLYSTALMPGAYVWRSWKVVGAVVAARHAQFSTGVPTRALMSIDVSIR